jgi:sarcosine oxidase subunit gamma
MVDGEPGPTFDGLTMRQIRLAGICVLRLRAGSPAIFRALSRACELNWPTTPNHASRSSSGLTALWSGPLEWTLIGQPVDVLGRRLAMPLAGHLHLLTDVTAGRACFEIDGIRSRELLAKGCSLDTHPKVFSDVHCAQTLLAQVPVLLHQPREGDEFQLVVDSSLGPYLNAWLTDAALEYTS